LLAARGAADNSTESAISQIYSVLISEMLMIPSLPRARVEGQREMLLPIPGKKATEENKLVATPRRKAG